MGKPQISLLYILFFFIAICSVKGQNVAFETTDSFYNYELFKNDQITWGYLTVPENWENKNSTAIKIAVTVLKNTANDKNAKAIVFIQGGPGASGIATIWSWWQHPLRKTHDIILLDIRGTGFSSPRLCPDLGGELLEILAKNLPVNVEENQKINAVLSCKQELIKKGIEVEAYHSEFIAQDLHALKEKLNYTKWNVYGVSYGTYIAQIYASEFPNDIITLTLDSSIDDISTYYTKNTSNYINSLTKVFAACNGDPTCKASYPELENIYYDVIKNLKEKPITVTVDESVVQSGTFTFNAEDFKIAIHQALYNKQLVEMIPLLIYQFHAENKDVLGNLVPAFSSLLQMDYGVYYCISCNETLPANDFENYQKNAAQFDALNGGLLFYKSDFKVCEKWNLNRKDSLHNNKLLNTLKETRFPVLILSGEYDPITPQENGKATANNFKSATDIIGKTYGHIPGFTKIGNEVATKFITKPHEKLDKNAFEKAAQMTIVQNIHPNAGVSKVGNSISTQNLLFLLPLMTAIAIMLIFIFIHIISFIKSKHARRSDKIIRLLIVVTSSIGLFSFVSLVLSIIEISNKNYYILAVGLPNEFNYIFGLLTLFLGLFIITILFFVLQIKKITNRSILSSILLSNMLLAVYLMYWGVV